MPQEADAEPRALGGTLDETRDVGHHERAVLAAVDDTEVRVQRGEGVVRDLRARRGHRADERRLAGVRQAEQTHIGDHLELELEQPLLAGQPGPELARRAVGAGLELGVAPTALAAARHEQRIAGAHEVAQLLAGLRIPHHRADRHRHIEIVAAAAGAVVAAARLARLRLEIALDTEVRERVDALGRAQPDAAAETAVTAVRAAERHELLAPETQAAAAAVTGLHAHLGFIDEFHGGALRVMTASGSANENPGARPGFAWKIRERGLSRRRRSRTSSDRHRGA